MNIKVFDSNIEKPKDRGILLRDIIQTDVIPDRSKSLTLTSSYRNNPSVDEYVNKKLKQLIPVVKKNGNLVQQGDKSNCLDANYSKGLDCHQQRTGIAMITNINPSGKGANGIVYDIDGGKAPTITTNKGEGSKIGCVQVGVAKGINGHGILKRVYSENGKAPTINSCKGGNREPKVAIIDKIYNGRKRRIYYDKAPTIRARRHGLDVKIEQRPRGFNKGGIKGGGKTPPLTSNSWEQNNKLTKNNVIWRKLTPIECERLQTIEDGYTECVSNSRRYQTLGNSWTVDVIVHILKGMRL